MRVREGLGLAMRLHTQHTLAISSSATNQLQLAVGAVVLRHDDGVGEKYKDDEHRRRGHRGVTMPRAERAKPFCEDGLENASVAALP